jgi:hypothetical protein
MVGWVVSTTPRPLYHPGERPGTHHCTGGWVGPQGLGWTGAENLAPHTGIRSADRQSCDESLYRLSYPTAHRSTLPSTSALDGEGVVNATPRGSFTPGVRDPVPIV